jgi:hypothetical protein
MLRSARASWTVTTPESRDVHTDRARPLGYVPARKVISAWWWKQTSSEDCPEIKGKSWILLCQRPSIDVFAPLDFHL